jgi:hypothetical protein
MGNPSVDVSGMADVWRVRLERWRRVRHLLDSAELGAGRLRHECLQAAGSILQLLAPDELGWEYPSPARVAELRRQLTDGDIAPAAETAREIMSVLERSWP